MKLRPALRIYLVVYGGLITLSAYLIGHNYQRQLQQAEESTLSRLYGIASTLSQQVNRNAIQGVFEEFPFGGDTSGISQNEVLKMYSALFQRTVESNGLKTPIYTLTYDSLSGRFFGGIASNGTATYGWHYKSPPAKLKEVYASGGYIPCFEDDHGAWLTAVCPLINSSGHVFAVIEADYPFDTFLAEARNELLESLLISLLVMLGVGAIIYPFLSQILSAEERSKQALESANERIKEKNNEVVSSLQYARTIQETMLPANQELGAFFSECFVFNLPRDIVSGDFYWFHQLDTTTALVAVADCTGHGVPGALMSIMGHSYLNEVVIEQSIHSPKKILERLNKKIQETFATDSGNNAEDGSDGMDMGICLISKGENRLTFAGARRPLTIIDNGTTTHVAGTRRGIGEHYLTTELPFENTEVQLSPTAAYYLYSDGMQDQFGGEKGKKLMRKRLNQWFTQMGQLPEDLKVDWLQTKFIEWRSNHPQVDDICILGFKV